MVENHTVLDGRLRVGVLEAERLERAVVVAVEDPDRLGCRLVLGEVTGRELRAVLELRQAERQPLAVIRAERERADVRQAGRNRWRR